MQTKYCPKCNVRKPESDFRKHRGKCRKCENKLYYVTQKERRTMKTAKKTKRTNINLPDGFYKVIDGLAIPVKTRLSLIETKYAFLKTMKENQCVQITDKAIWSSALTIANNYGKKSGKTFTGRTIPAESGGGFGIWRIK